MRYFLIFSILFIGFVSCNSNKVSEDNFDINKFWKADSVVTFWVTIPNTSVHYNLFFLIRNGVEFPHSNLYLKYALKDKKGGLLESKLINMQLFNAKTGYPLGNGIGSIFEHQYELLTKYQFNKSGQYQLSFQQYMRYDSLPEIYSVGYRIEKTKTE
jgi:gliding motility-associated lipoprotein GldH